MGGCTRLPICCRRLDARPIRSLAVYQRHGSAALSARPILVAAQARGFDGMNAGLIEDGLNRFHDWCHGWPPSHLA